MVGSVVRERRLYVMEIVRSQRGPTALRRASLVPVVKTANLGNLYHLTMFECLDRARFRRIFLQGQMRSGPVIVAQISFENNPQVEFAEHDDMVEAISP
jgi:hypothetical protein